MSWTVKNLCRGSPSPDSKYIKDEIEILNEMFKFPDNEILRHVGGGFSSLTDPSAKMVIKECGVLKRLIECLNRSEYDVRLAMLRALGN